MRLRTTLPTLYFDLQAFDDAIFYYQKSIAINPQFFEAYFNLGCVYENINKIDLAEATYTKILTQNNRLSNAYFSIADLFKATKTHAGTS